MKNGRQYHTILYRLLSLLLVLTMLTGHVVPLSYATDEEVSGQDVLVSAEAADAHQGLLTDANEEPDEVQDTPEPGVNDSTVSADDTDTRTLVCQLSEHVHDEELCWQQTLICGMEEDVIHEHDDACVQETTTLTCTLQEKPFHIHTAACNGLTEKLTCGLEETEPHVHSAENGCFTAQTTVTCGQLEVEPHTHSDECKGEAELTCTLPEDETHTHGDSCYTTNEIYICGLEETVGHSHAPECYKTEDVLTCKLEVTEGHAHSDACKTTETGLICNLEATEGHAHSETCYQKTTETLCTLTAGVPHAHGETCYSEQKTLICTQQEHTHGESCYQSALLDQTVEDWMKLVSVSGELPEGVTLQAEILYGTQNREELKQQIFDYLRDDEEVAFGYDIWLELDGAEYQPEGLVTVTVKMSDAVLAQLGYDSVEALAADLTLYHIHDDGIQNLWFSANNVTGTLTFEVDGFSVFIGTIDLTDEEIWGTVTIGEVVYTVKNVNTLVDADLALLRNEAMGTHEDAVEDDQISAIFGEYTFAGFDAVYDAVYELLLAKATKTFDNETIATDKEITDTQIWKISGNVSLGTTTYGVRGDAGRLIVVSEDPSTSISMGTSGRVTTGFKSITGNTRDCEKAVFSVQGKNISSQITIKGKTVSGNVETLKDYAIKIFGGSAYLNYVDITDFSVGDSDEYAVIGFPEKYNNARYLYMAHSAMRKISGVRTPGIFCMAYDSDGDNDRNELSQLWLYDNHFYECLSTDKSGATTGGAVIRSYAADNCNLRAELCLFYDNQALVESESASGGGAVYWKSAAGSATFENCTFSNNTTNSVGGAIYNTGTMTIKGCKFENNYGKLGGGAIAVEPPRTSKHYANIDTQNLSGSLTLDDQTVLQGNTTDAYGGGIYFYGIKGTNGTNPKNGGEDIEIYTMRLSIDGATITDNSARDGGGVAMMLAHTEHQYETGIEIKDGSTISDNTATQNGGAIWMYADENCNVTNSDGVEMAGGEMKINQATQYGGSVYMSASSTANGDMKFTMTGGTLESSTAKDGGAVYMKDGIYTMSDGLITKGTANQNGGAVYLGGGEVNISGGSISDSTAAKNGGGIYLGGGELNISGGAVSNNIASKNGGGAYVKDGSIYMSGGEVSGNTATSGVGGGMYVSAESTDVNVMIFSGEVLNNRAATAGGAVAVYGEEQAENVITVQSGVDMLHPPTEGSNKHTKTGTVDESGEYTHITCPVISGNTTGEEGGAIYITGSTDTRLNVYCLEESGNTVDKSGDQLSHFLMVDGGKVAIDTGDKTGENGNVKIEGSVHVAGGQVDLYGVMTNPGFGSSISVDITKKGDYFEDHRPLAEDVFYKLRYFENFKDPETGLATGRYTAYQIPHNGTEKIKPVMYVHPGYEITGWNTHEEGLDDNRDHSTDDTGWYDVGDEYTFDGNPIGDLTLYAIWAPNVYTIIYDRNEPVGATIYGRMDDQMMDFGVPTPLSPNEYQYPGYRFVAWNTEDDGTGDSYEDMQLIPDAEQEIPDLCQKNGDTITLYAQWEKCDHDPDDCTFTYEEDDGTLIRICECEGQVVEITLSAEDHVYTWDEDSNKAIQWPVEVNIGVVEGDLHEEDPWYDDEFGIDYEVYQDGAWKSHSDVPSNAGQYRASIVGSNDNAQGNLIDTVAISSDYIIKKAEQPVPEVSGFTVNENTLTVNEVASSKHASHDTKIETIYQLFYYIGSTLNHSDPTDLNEFTLETSYTSYYVEVWYSEGENHEESEHARTQQVFYKGNTEIVFKVKDGIDAVVTEDDGGLLITVSAKTGWYLTDGFSVSIDPKKDKGVIETISQQQEYRLVDVPDEENLIVTVTISGAQKLTGVIAKVAEKKVFGSVTKDSISISRDSAFTAAYQIGGFNGNVYGDLSLQFGELPKGTTILMMDKGNSYVEYWCYEELEEINDTILLTEFKRMGGTDTFTVVEDMNLQFIVDFSATETGCAGDSVSMLLTASKKDTSAPDLKSLYTSPEIKLHDVGTFAMDLVQTQQALTQEITLNYTASDGATSKWDSRAATLVLTQDTGDVIPDDALMRITNNNTLGSSRWAAHRDNGKMRFIIPLNSISDGSYTLELESDMLPNEAKTYSFTAMWYISESIADEAPINGICVKMLTDSLKFVKAQEQVPSVKVFTEDNTRVFDSGSQMMAKVMTSVPQTHSVKAELLWKPDGQDYAKTNWWKNVETNTTTASTVVVPLSTDLGEGSFCLMVTVTHGTEIVLEVPFYFIIQQPANDSTS